MKSLGELVAMTRNPEFTKEQAEAVIAEQVREMVDVLKYGEAEARKLMLANIGYYAGYYPHDVADRVYDLYGTEHPVFGRKHPTPAEAFKAGFEMAQKQMNEEKEN